MVNKPSIFVSEEFVPNCVIGVIAPEVSLKTKKVQERFHNILKKNVLCLLEKNSVSFSSIKIVSGRVIVFSNDTKKVISVLKNCFGIFFLMSALEKKFSGFDEVTSFAVTLFENNFDDSFAIRCKSFLKNHSSKLFEIEIGSLVLKNNPLASVNLTSPSIQLNLIVFNTNSFFYFDVVSGAKGLPVSSQGSVVLVSKNVSKSKLLLESLQKCGCRVFVVGNNFFGEESFNVSLITIEKALIDYDSGKIFAFFSDVEDIKEKKLLDKKLGVKTFATFLK